MAIMATTTPLPSASTELDALVRTQQDAMRVLRGVVDALRDIKKEERVDAEVRQAIRNSELPSTISVHDDDDDSVVCDADLMRVTSGLQQLFRQLTQAMTRIDALEAAPMQRQTQLRPVRANERPPAPAGLLSLRDYSVLQAALEVYFCWGVFPVVDSGLLLPLDKRRATKTLAISRYVLAWGSTATQTGTASRIHDLEATGRHVVAATQSMLQLLLLPQLQPILLPKYVVEIVALLVYGEIHGDFADATREQSQQMLEKLLRVLPLRLGMTSLRAALGQCGHGSASGSPTTRRVVAVFKRRCGKLLAQLLMEDGGVLTTIEMLLGAVDEGDTQARMQVATLICQCPASIEPTAYTHALARQVRALLDDANRQNKLLRETAVVLMNELAARSPQVFDTELLVPMLEPLLAYEFDNSNGNRVEMATENEIGDCVALLHLLLCGPPPSMALVRALVPVFRPLVHLCGFAVASKSFLASSLQQILIALIKATPQAALLLQVSVLPVAAPLRCSLVPCGFRQQTPPTAVPTSAGSSWRPLFAFAAGGSGGIAMRRVVATTIGGSDAQDEDDSLMAFRLAIAALVELLGSTELESSTVVGELFASLLLTYMRVRKSATTFDEDDTGPRDTATQNKNNDDSDEMAAYEAAKAPQDALGVELTLSLLLAVIESLGPSVLRSAETVLQCLTIVLGMFASTRASLVESTQRDESQNDQDGDEDDEVLTVCLGLVMTILEAGAHTRSNAEEAELRAMLPVLEKLSQYPRAQIAELATDARASILSRGASSTGSGRERGTSTTEQPSFSQTLRAAATDLQSSLVPLRARGVVALTKLVRRSLPHRGDEQWTPHITQLMDVFVDHLADSESYVFLAAVQGLAALADAHPDVAIPMLTQHLRDKTHSLEKRIKLSEALLFTAKRCGDTLPKYAKMFVYSYLECIRPAPSRPGNVNSNATTGKKKSFSLIEELDPHETTTASPLSDDELLLTDEQREAKVQAANAALAEATLRASCLSNLAEVSAMLQWSLTPFAADVLSCVFGILQIELDQKPTTHHSAVAVRRGAVFLLKYVLQLAGYKILEVLPDQLKPMYHTLKHVQRVDPDSVVTFHARQALETLDEIMRAELFPTDGGGGNGGGGLGNMLRIVKHS